MTFETHAIVELMGHARIAGKLTEQVIAGMAMLRVDVPKTSRREPFTKYYNASAVYSITPTDEATATLAAERIDEPPVQPWVVPLPTSPALAEKVIVYNGHDDFDEDDDDFDDGDDSPF